MKPKKIYKKRKKSEFPKVRVKKKYAKKARQVMARSESGGVTGPS